MNLVNPAVIQEIYSVFILCLPLKSIFLPYYLLWSDIRILSCHPCQITKDFSVLFLIDLPVPKK